MIVGKNTRLIWGMFLLWPFMSLLLALKNFRNARTKNILWAFTVFYGYTFVIRGTMDSNRYRDTFLDLANNHLSFYQFQSTLYSTETNTVDLFQPLLTYFVAQFTNNYQILFAIFGLIYGYFYSRNIWYVLEQLKERIKPIYIPLILSFVLVIPIWNLNGFRFYTAAHVFIFGILPYLFEKKKNLLIFSFASVFIHFSFLFPVMILAVYFLLKNRTTIYFYFFLISLFITEINLNIVNSRLKSNLPSIFHQKVDAYVNEDRVRLLSDRNTEKIEKNWYARYYGHGLKWFIILFLIIFFYKEKDYIQSIEGNRKLFSFCLLFYSCANIFSLVPSGGRFLAIANMMSLVLIILCIKHFHGKKYIRITSYLSYPLLLLFVVVSIRNGFDTIGAFTVLGNPIIAIFISNNIALIDLVKQIL